MIRLSIKCCQTYYIRAHTAFHLSDTLYEIKTAAIRQIDIADNHIRITVLHGSFGFSYCKALNYNESVLLSREGNSSVHAYFIFKNQNFISVCLSSALHCRHSLNPFLNKVFKHACTMNIRTLLITILCTGRLLSIILPYRFLYHILHFCKIILYN